MSKAKLSFPLFVSVEEEFSHRIHWVKIRAMP